MHERNDTGRSGLATAMRRVAHVLQPSSDDGCMSDQLSAPLTTKELQYQRPEQLVFDALVLRARKNEVVLDRSAFGPDWPNIAGDRGTIGFQSVVRSFRSATNEHVHVVPAAHDIVEGQLVSCVVDRYRRSQISRAHSLLHMLRLGLQSVFDVSTQSGTVGPGLCSIDVCDLSHELQPLHDWVKTLVSEGRQILTWADPADGRRRFWTIDGVGTIPCSGVHPSTTAAIGPFQIKRSDQEMAASSLIGELG